MKNALHRIIYKHREKYPKYNKHIYHIYISNNVNLSTPHKSSGVVCKALSQISRTVFYSHLFL